jgi:hypothetical protein
LALPDLASPPSLGAITASRRLAGRSNLTTNIAVLGGGDFILDLRVLG